MNKILHLSLHNFKKDKKQFISFGVIMLVTALILNLALVLAFSIGSAYDDKAAELHSADIDAVVPKIAHTGELQEKITSLDNVTAVEARDGVMLPTVIKDFRATDFDLGLIFYNLDDPHQLNCLESIEESDSPVSNPVYLPLYIAEFGQFAVGETFTVEVDGQEYTYTVAGVVQEMQYGNAGSGRMGVFLPEAPYKALVEEFPSSEIANYAVTTSDGADNQAVLADITEIVENNGAAVLFSLTSQSKKQTRTMVSSLLTVILIVFAGIVLLVSVFLCKFRISQTVEEEMTQLGVLKGLGFTSRMIIASVVIPYAMIALAFAALGTALSYVLLPALVNMLAMQAGFRFDVGFHGNALALTVSLLTAVTLLFTCFAAGKIRRLLPIMAIRGLTEDGKTTRNHFPIDKTPGNIQLLLMLKQMASSARQNGLLFVVLSAMTVLIAFSGTLFYNVIIKPDNFMSTLSEESPDVVLRVSSSDIRAVKREISSIHGAAKVLEYAVIPKVSVEGRKAAAFVSEDFSQVKNDLCYEGRNPVSPDETAIGNALAESLALDVGDSVTVGYGDNSRQFNIVGLIQSVNYNGEICELTNAGFEALSQGETSDSLYVYLADGADADEFIHRAEIRLGTQIISSVNGAKKQREAQSIYSVIVNIVVAAIFAVTSLIVLLILFVIIKSMITRRRQEFGICKAIGFSGRQLILQAAGSLMPVTVAAVLVSALPGLLYIPAMNNAIFGMVGAIKNNLQVSAAVLLILAAAEILVTFAMSIALASPIKKIEAYSLIKE